MGQFQDLTGHRFGRLTVLYRVRQDGCAATVWHCRCDCGKEKDVRASKLKTGNTRSCGCLRSELVKESNIKHNMSHTRLYGIWSNMKRRCDDPNNPKFKNYGARGIKVCEEWYNSEIFFEWALTNGYNDNLTIDRIDVNKGYYPENCRWIGIKEQSLNRTDNHFLIMRGKRQTMKEWSVELGIPYRKLERLINEKHISLEKIAQAS